MGFLSRLSGSLGVGLAMPLCCRVMSLGRIFMRLGGINMSGLCRDFVSLFVGMLLLHSDAKARSLGVTRDRAIAA